MTMDEMLTEVIGSRDVVQRDRFLDQGHPLMPQPVARNGNAQRVACSPSADRVRLSRARHKRHERVVPIEVRDSEIAALVTHGFLAPDRTDDLRAIETRSADYWIKCRRSGGQWCKTSGPWLERRKLPWRRPG